MGYRISRNLEATIIQFIEQALIDGSWSGINVEKAFARIYTLETPAICVRVSDTTHDKAELGTEATVRTPLVLIDIFAHDDGQRLDLKDFLISKLKKGMPYYEYEITNGTISGKTQNGRIRVLTISDTLVNLNVDKSSLDPHDRYRHLLSLSLSLGKLEN